MPGKTITQVEGKIKQFPCMKRQKIKFTFCGHFLKNNLNPLHETKANKSHEPNKKMDLGSRITVRKKPVKLVVNVNEFLGIILKMRTYYLIYFILNNNCIYLRCTV